MNINQQVQDATQEYLDSDKLKNHIKDQAESMINKIIDDALGNWGAVTKQIESAVKEEIQLNIKDLGIGGLSTFLTDVVKEKLHKNIREDAAKKIGDEMEKILTPIEKVVSIETLKKELLSDAYTHDLDICGDVKLNMLDGEMGYYESDVFTFIVQQPSGANYDWVDIYMDVNPNKSHYDCAYNLTVHENFTSFKINEREIKAQDKVFNRDYGLEDFIYQMYLNNSTIDHNDAKSHAE